jgi:importin subunit alpha-1
MTFADNWQQIHKFLLKESMILLYHEIFKLYSSPAISESVVWLLGNLISNQIEDRDKIIASSFFEKICELLQTDKIHEGFLRNAIWFFSTCLKHYFNDEVRVRRCLNIFINFIKLDDEEIRTECLNGLAKITEYDDPGIASTMLSSEICKLIIGIQNKKYIVSSIRTLGNLLTGSNQTTDYLIEIGVIPFLQKFLYHKIPNIRKEALWALSNITAGTLTHVKAALNSGVVMNAVALTKDSDREVTREALLVVTNVIANSDEETLMYMRELKFIECFIWILKNYKDPELVLIVLKSILDFLRKGDLDKMTVEEGGNKETTNSNAIYFEMKGGLEILQMLLFDKSENVYQLTSYIITQWYASKTEECKYS